MNELLKDLTRDCRLFTREEEAALFYRWRHDGDESARNSLIVSVMPFALSIAKQFVKPGLDIETLVSVAFETLCDRIDGFDPKRGRLTTISKIFLRRALARYCVTQRHVIYVPEVSALMTEENMKKRDAVMDTGVMLLGGTDLSRNWLGDNQCVAMF